MKIKVPLKFGWLVADKRYHIAIINTYYVSRVVKKTITAYTCLCNMTIFLASNNPISRYYIWPNGSDCIEILSTNTVCKKCLKLHGEDLTFPLIKAKLGVKNPFD